MRVCVRWRGAGAQLWCALLAVAVLAEVASLSGPNVCMVKQKYNITKRVKYRAPMSVRTYEWCFSMPPRCSRWSTEMRDLTRLETEERTAEVAVCCPGYKMKDVSCVPICPYGKTGPGCSDDCPENKWGPNCVYNCSQCAEHGGCSPLTGDCECEDGWQGESCEFRMSTTQATTTVMEKLLTTSKPTTITNPTTGTSLSRTTISNASTASSTTLETSTVTPFTSEFTSSSSTTSNSPKSTTSTLATSPKETPTTTEINLTTRKIELENLSGRKNIYESVENFESTTLMSTTNQIRNYENITITTEITSPIASTTVPTTTGSTKNTKSIYNRTEISLEIVSTTPSFDKMLTSTNPILTTVDNITKQPLITTTEKKTETYTTRANIFTSTEKELTTKLEATKRHETTTRTLSTVKFKPKEIWIKPTQKEPEHITAVMNEKERDRTSMDLISVVSIAGGVMMAVITVAVLIVMVERCRRPRFEQVRKVNDIRMQVTIDNNDAPPPYTRSIFHTPLPEPPSDKCHYQPISTLDRNLKQFMRPVVVQNISPIMLENFRGILECHYDHLPRRNHDFGTMPSRFAAAPSMSYSQERYQKSRSVHDSTIDALKCEAKLDAIDASTSEPLYAEIPCWRPPSEHAIEVLNLNGEAITEL
ncbi:PREDICTED: flocculation protein FLO11-like isoform X3 [Papilio xuthus]|uniref:Flocculation protein FLO11-like isoform X3 n=1 Tax=Papilio xuthus TaxID=66420 RepID=A0AAJ6Z4I2_PAPXU|nr:PREDICTED: flocculation protein FLO11-like isoform X3 [Papilio xuthus]